MIEPEKIMKAARQKNTSKPRERCRNRRRW